jgi:hypothetical protein
MRRSQLGFAHGEYVVDAVNAGPVFLVAGSAILSRESKQMVESEFRT